MPEFAVVYDNEAVEPFIPAWGFSCFVHARNTSILFDTGWDGEILLHNLSLFGIEDFDFVVLSHQHWDHIGGLNHVISRTSYVVVPSTFSPNLKREIARKAELVEVTSPREIAEGIYTTGVLTRPIPEQSLVVEVGRGVFVITGCSHPGLEAILRVAEKFGKVYGVMGGFHGFSRVELLRDYELVIPCHCTVAKEEILKMDNSRRCYAGCSFNL